MNKLARVEPSNSTRSGWSGLLRIFLVCTVLFVFFVVLFIASFLTPPAPYSLDPDTRLEPIDPASLGSLKSLSIRFVDRAKASHTSGHVHSPFGTRGTDSYLYDGRLVAGDLEGRLKIEDYEPIAALLYDKRTILLARGFFRQNNHSFRWLAPNSDATFEEISVRDLPRDTWFLRFRDSIQTYLYRTHMLKTLGEAAGAPTALEYFDALVAADPDCMRLAYSSQWDRPSSISYGEFLDNVVAKSKDPRFAPGLTRVLYSFGPRDIPVNIHDTIVAIFEVDSVYGCETYWKYHQHVIAQQIKDDKRVDSLRYNAEMLNRFGCKDPTPTSQPQVP